MIAKHRSKLAALLLSVTAGLFGLLPLGCATPHMAVPPEMLQVAEELPVVDRSAMSGALVNESFKMGPYQIADVDRKWNSTSSTSIGPYASADTTGGYTFALKASDGGEYKGECASRKDSKQVSALGGTFGQQKYEILCHCAGATQASFTMKADDGSAKFQGTLQSSQASYTLSGVYANDKGGTTSDPLGYDVRGTEPLGAVETTGKGRVWMSRSLRAPVREETACLFAGLLLYKAPQKAFEK